MAFVVDDVVGKINKCLNEEYQMQLAKQLDLEIEQMLRVVECITAFYALPANERSSPTQKSKYNESLISQVDNAWLRPEAQRIEKSHETLWTSLKVIFSELSRYISEEQKRERFYAVRTDSTWIKILKLGKRICFNLSSLPNGLANLFRKNKIKKTYWPHDILLQNLAKKHFLVDTINGLQEVSALYYTRIAAHYVNLKKWEAHLANEDSNIQTFDAKSLLAFKQNLLKELQDKISSITEPSIEKFQADYAKAGTLELPEGLLSDHLITKKVEAAKDHWSKLDLEWRNTLFSFFEELRLDLHIQLLMNNTLASFEDFQSAQFKKIDDYIGPEMKEIQSFIDEGLHSIDHPQESLQKEFKRLNYQAVKKLDKEVVPRLCDKLSNQTVINLINKLEVTIAHRVEELSDERIIVKTDTYDNPLSESDLHLISPHELIAFEMLPKFKKHIASIKQRSFAALEKTTENVQDLDHVITFSLSSAIATLDNQSNSEEALSIAKEGLKRAADRLEEERQTLNQSMANTGKELEEAVNEFCHDIMELTFNENVRQLRLRVTKAKATQQAKEVRLRLEKKVAKRKQRALLMILSIYNRLRHSIHDLSQNFVLTAKKPEISKQVSDFLLESQQAIDKLPLIYKRLYQIEPVIDLELFEGRQDEMQTLKKAFESWEKGHFAATAVVGEKWGGLTSYLNYSTHKHNFRYSHTRHEITNNVYNQAHFIQLMQSLFKNDSLESVDHVIQYLNDSPKRVVILEDIHNLYQRKIHGFEALQQLFRLINKTYKNIFWVISCNIYTWSYLKKTVNINEYFSYMIELKMLTNEQIINIIWKRNKISGFKIRFEVDQHTAEDKKFIKLAEEDQQQWLMKKFFSELNIFAQSNISLALIYWLLSTKEVDESTITIGAFKKPNLNFLTVLAMDKLYALHALILHDGLSDRQLAEILNTTEKSSELTLLALLEDGILIREEDRYMVNPIVYRSTISLLKSKNLIH